MPRAASGVPRHKRQRKYIKLARGYFGRRGKNYRFAKQNVIRGWSQAYVGRKQKKRDFRRLWVARINAATNQHDLSYSKFMSLLKKANVEMNRKMLAEIAIHDPIGFEKLISAVKNS